MQNPGSPNHPWLLVGWSVSVLGSPPINNPRLVHFEYFWLVAWSQPMQPIKNIQNGPNAVYILIRNNQDLISVHLWNNLSTFIPKHFLQNLKHPLVAKRTIYGRTLGRPVDSWVVFGDWATIFQQHCYHWLFISFVIQWIAVILGKWKKMCLSIVTGHPHDIPVNVTGHHILCMYICYEIHNFNKTRLFYLAIG